MRRRQHHLAPPGRRRRNRAVLRVGIERADRAQTTSVFASTRSLSSVSVRRISAAPGRKASTEPGSARSARITASAIWSMPAN